MGNSTAADGDARDRVRWAGFLVLAVVASLLILLPPVDAMLETHEALHHLQHGIAFLASLGAGLAAYRLFRAVAPGERGWWRSTARALLLADHRANPGGLPALLLAATLVVFWHIPLFFNLAVENDAVHVAEHFCFLVAGGAVGFGLHRMGTWTRLGSLLATILTLTLLSSFLVVFQPWVYRVYPVEHEFIVGIGMIYTMMPLMVYAVFRFLVEQVS